MTDTCKLRIEVSDPAVRALLPNYLARRRQDVCSIKAWLDENAFDRIAVVAHRMRGSGSAYGVDFVTRLGAQLEAGAVACDTQAVARAVHELATTLARVELL